MRIEDRVLGRWTSGGRAGSCGHQLGRQTWPPANRRHRGGGTSSTSGRVASSGRCRPFRREVAQIDALLERRAQHPSALPLAAAHGVEEARATWCPSRRSLREHAGQPAPPRGVGRTRGPWYTAAIAHDEQHLRGADVRRGLSRRMCCSRVCSAMRGASRPCESTLTPMMRPCGMNSSRAVETRRGAP